MPKALVLVLILAPCAWTQAGTYKSSQFTSIYSYDTQAAAGVACTGAVRPTLQSDGSVVANISASCTYQTITSTTTGTISLRPFDQTVTIDSNYNILDSTGRPRAFSVGGTATYTENVEKSMWLDFQAPSITNGQPNFGACGNFISKGEQISCGLPVLYFPKAKSQTGAVLSSWGVRVGIENYPVPGFSYFDVIVNYAPVSTGGGGAPNITIDHIEFVQAVQDSDNNLDLVANKDTMMRIFPAVVGSVPGPLSGVTATVTYTPAGGSPVTKPITSPVTANVAPVDRSVITNSLNFVLPPEMTAGTGPCMGPVSPPRQCSSFTVQLVYPVQPPDPSPGYAGRTQTVTQAFQTPNQESFKVGWIPICLTIPGANFGKACPSNSLANRQGFSQKVFPVSNQINGAIPQAAFIYEPIPIDHPPTFTIPDGNFRAVIAARKIQQFLDQVKDALDLELSGPLRRYNVLIGWVPLSDTADLTSSSGLINTPSAYYLQDSASRPLILRSDALGNSALDNGFASEKLLGFFLARATGLQANIPPTRSLTTGEIGIDVASQTIHSTDEPDLLTISAFNGARWISPNTWSALGQKLNTLPPPGSTASPRSLALQTTEYAIITGSVQQDNSTAQIDPILRLTSSVTLAPASTTGAYCLQVGSGSTVLATPCFDIDFSPDSTGAIPPVGFFELAIPWPAGATQIQLLHGGSPLTSLTAVAGNPTVTINSPHQGDVWNAPNTITWSASPAASSTVLYSIDGGLNWLPLAINITDSQYAVDTTMLKGGSQVLFRVIVSNGINTASATVGPITINQTPAVQGPASVSFGTLITGAWADQTAHISNTGSGPLTIQSLSTDNPAFTVRAGTPFDIKAGDGFDVAIRFTAGASGAGNGNLIVTSNDPVHGTIRIPLVANASTTAVPNLVPLPATVSFGDVSVGQTLDVPISIVNNGSAALNVTGASVTGPFQITAGMTPFAVPAYGQQALTVRFAPTVVGTPQTGTLAMSTNDTGHPSISISLVGNGVVGCTYSLSAAAANLGSSATSGTVTLTTGPTCTWAVSGNALWLTSPQTSGTGTAAINYSVAANNTGAQRIGTLLIANQTFTVTQSPAMATAPVLGITVNHNPSSFMQGQSGSYMITVSNTGSAATSSGVTVTVTLPPGLTATSTSGTGWSCASPSGPCTRSDTLPQGSSYSPITLAVNVAGNAPVSVINTVTVSGGGAPNATVSDTATVVGTTLRTLVYHEITSLNTSANSGSTYAPVLSKNGSRAAFTTGGGSPFQVFIVNADGNTAPTQVDSFTRLCSCGASVSISDDGSAVASTDGLQVRYAPANGSGGRSVITVGNTGVSAMRLSSDGSTIFFILSGDGTLNGTQAARGLYAINVTGSGLHQIVASTAVGTVLATAASILFGDPGYPVVDSSADNSKIIFSVNVLGVGAYLMAANSNGQNLHKVVGPLSETYYAGISADGSTVYYDAVPQASGSPSQVGVVNYDGSNNRVLDTGLDGAGRPGQISADGSLVYVENGGRVYHSDGSGFYPLALNSPGANSHPVIGSFNASMNSTGTRFLYLVGDASGIRQLATIDVNPSTTGAAPAITNPSVTPPFVLVNGGSAATLSAGVSTSNTLAGVVGMVVKNGVPDPNINGQTMFDDGTHGDAAARDGVFTNNGVRTDCCATAGTRTARIQAEDTAGARRHATAVDLAQFAVVSTIPTTAITIGTSPTGRSFTVDGATYTSSQTLNLNQGSTHTIAVGTTPQAGATGTQYLFTNWSDSGAASHSITVGAAAATYTANFKTQYQLTIQASAGGTVSPQSGTFYDAGTVVPITATANSGFIFANWTGNVASATSASTTVTMNAPATVTANFSGITTSGLRFIPVTPCRIIDTRLANGNFGGPAIAAGGTRMVPIPLSACNIPVTAQAYSLNATVVPIATLGYLSIWPAGQDQPVVSTLNSYDGRIVANAAIVPAGANGAINLFASDATHVILDINGYFAPASTPNSFSFYSLTPCRVADTRSTSLMTGNSTRNFAIFGAPCNAPSTANAYSLNITVVPRGHLGYLTTWPAGQTQPVVSTLNSTDGSVVANAAVVPAGTGGAISVYVTDNTDVIIDINGYFAPPGSPAAQSLYTVAPCRVVDTRSSGGPLAVYSQRSFQIPTGPCPGIPSSSQAYSLNVTVVPTNMLTYLTAWPSGQTQPVVSTLNSFLGKIVANAAIVPAGQNAAISIFVTDPTQLILDINAYFAP